MSSSGCSSSNQEAVISVEIMGLKVYQKESGLRGRWKKSFYLVGVDELSGVFNLAVEGSQLRHDLLKVCPEALKHQLDLFMIIVLSVFVKTNCFIPLNIIVM